MLKKIPVSVLISVSASLLLLAAVLTFPGSFGFTRTEQVIGITNPDGFLLTAELPQGIARQRGREFLFPDYPVILEDGNPLERPRATDKQITNAGRGRYQFSGSKIHFSTSDGAPSAGRVYSVRAPKWSLRESLLLAVWLVGLASSAIAFRLAMPRGAEALIQSPSFRLASLALTVALIAAFFFFRSAVSDQFFLGLVVPAAWAALMGLNAIQRGASGRAGLLALALVPAWAGYFYYGLNGASNSSFLVAGVIPRSDAWLHFVQAAEIALHGTTQQIFNGRFLYPAFYSVFLDIAGLNVLVANLLVSCLVMLGLAFTCWAVAARTGGAGAAVYCFLFWLYFRAHGCGLLMTENLGILMGVIGLGFLLLSADRKMIWPVFVSLMFFGLGSVARPGALFILPALALYAGIRVWGAAADRRRMVAAAGAVIVGLALVAGCFGANHLLIKSLCSVEGKPFGNFAFTLQGLLNNSNWSASAHESGWNTAAVMDQNIRQIKESPASLLRGIGRAYGETFKKGFLFRFGAEKRLASSGMALFVLAFLSCCFWKPLRGDSGWILLLSAGILASIPFAPPWDAGERPYAATVPVQIFLAAAGFSLLIALLRKAAESLIPGDVGGGVTWSGAWSPVQAAPHTGGVPVGPLLSKANGIAFFGFAALCLFLVLPAPLILKLAGYRHPAPSQTPAFLPGSSLLVSEEGPSGVGHLSLAAYLDRLSDFQAAYPDQARIYASEPSDFLLGITWNDLQPLVLPSPAKGP